MNPSDNVHKTILKPGDTKNPMANANAGRHQKKNIVVPLHNTSRCCGLQVLGSSLMFPRVKVTYASSSVDASSPHADLDYIAILQAEMTRTFRQPNDEMRIELSHPPHLLPGNDCHQETSNGQHPAPNPNSELCWCASQGAGEWWGDVGSHDLFGWFVGSWLFGR